MGIPTSRNIGDMFRKQYKINSLFERIVRFFYASKAEAFRAPDEVLFYFYNAYFFTKSYV